MVLSSAPSHKFATNVKRKAQSNQFGLQWLSNIRFCHHMKDAQEEMSLNEGMLASRVCANTAWMYSLASSSRCPTWPNFSCGFDGVPQDYTDTFRGLAKSSFQSWRFRIYTNPAYSMTSRLCWVPRHVFLRFLRGFNASCLSMFDFVRLCATCKEAA